MTNTRRSYEVGKVLRDVNLLDFEKSMLNNEPTLAIVAFDTAENEPSKVSQLDSRVGDAT